MPPDGKLDASGSPLISSLPLNSATARPSPVGLQETVVLLGGDAGHRLEPVRVVRRAVLDRPVLQRAGDDVGDRRIERLALGDGAPQRPVDILRQSARWTSSLNVSEPNSSVILSRRLRALAERHTPVTDAANGVAGGSGTHVLCPFVVSSDRERRRENVRARLCVRVRRASRGMTQSDEVRRRRGAI